MRKLSTACVLALITSFITSGYPYTAAFGQSEPSIRKQREETQALRGERYALLIGVHRYDKTSGLRPLSFTNNDVLKLAVLLTQAGYRSENIIVMTEDAQLPRLLPEKDKIANQVKNLLRDRSKEDSVIIGFAGHGVQFASDAESYFCPLDSKLDDKTTLISLGDLYAQLNDCQAGFKLVFCDACRNDPFPPTTRGLSLLDEEQRSPDRKPPTGIASFYSCSKGEAAYEDADLRHGVFFHFVIKGLMGESDLDKDRIITLPELEYFVKRRVSDYVRSEFSGQRQMPNLVGNTSGLFPIVILPKETITVRLPDGATPRQPKKAGDLPEENRPIKVDFTNTLSMPFVAIPPGDFVMGTDEQEFDDKLPLSHRVRITKPFYIGVYEVTQREYKEVMGTNPSQFQPNAEGWDKLKSATSYNEPYRRISTLVTDFHPVEQVSWQDAVEFCRRLSKRENRLYRLPYEAEWEYACRGGREGDYFWGDFNHFREYCFAHFTGGTTGPVGRLSPNDIGLYDMIGNVREFVADSFTHKYYSSSPSIDPKGPPEESRLKVVRGGCFSLDEMHSWGRASVAENRAAYNGGFRVVLELSDEEISRADLGKQMRAYLARIPDLKTIVRKEGRDDDAANKLAEDKVAEAFVMNPKLFFENAPDSIAVSNYSRGVQNFRAAKYHTAIVWYMKAINADDTAMWPRNNIAYLLATCPDLHIRDGVGAVRYAVEACEKAQWQYWGFLDTLACALAEAGEYDKSIECFELAKRLAVGSHRVTFEEDEEVWKTNLERARQKKRPVAKMEHVSIIDGHTK